MSHNHSTHTIIGLEVVTGFFTLATLAGEWSRQKDFHEWAGVENASEARALIMRICNVTNLAELNRDPAAAKMFRDEIRDPFQARLKGGDGR